MRVEKQYWKHSTVYCYHPDTKLFTYTLECDPHPTNPNLYLQPSHCTLLIPNPCDVYHKNFFNGESWEIVEDRTELEIRKQLKLSEIRVAFIYIFEEGFVSPSLDVKVDIRRNSTCNDLQNYEALLKYMKLSNTETTTLKLFDNSFSGPITIEELETLTIEIISYVMLMYNKKWLLEQLVTDASTYEELESIKW